MLDANLKQVMVEAEGSRKEAFLELLKRKEIESKVASAFVRVCSHLLSPSNISCLFELNCSIIFTVQLVTFHFEYHKGNYAFTLCLPGFCSFIR